MPRLSSLPSRTMTGTSVKYIPPSRQAILTLSNPNAYGTEVNDRFGSSVASSGNYVVVSAGTEDSAGVERSGKVYVFNKSNGNLLYTLTSPNPSGHPNTEIDSFGCALSISGNNLIVGARYDPLSTYVGRVYVYDITTGSLLRTIQSSLSAGYSIRDFGYSIDTWGDYLIVGAPWTSYSGTQEVGFAELFSISTGSSLRVFLNPASSADYAYDNFGINVAIHGTRVLIGASYDDISAVNAGRAYLFDRDAGTLLNTFLDPAPIASQDIFPTKVDLNDSYIMLAKNAVGKVYIHDASTYSQLYEIVNPNIETSSTTDGFLAGISRFYGNKFAVSASNEVSTNTGVAYIFDPSSGTPTIYSKVVNNPIANNPFGFGASIEIDEDSLVVGAPYANSNTGSSWSGKVAVFDTTVL